VEGLPALVEKHGVREIVIAAPSATPDQMARFIEICRRNRLRFNVLPSFRGFLDGGAREFSSAGLPVEHLLGRDPVQIDLEPVRRRIGGQVVLVTGAAGTIGSELCRQLLQCGPAKLVCLDRNENGVFDLQMELKRQEGDPRLVFCVSDLCDSDRVRRILNEHKPCAIFHAAAYKHVPMMENNVYEAVKNNVFALQELLDNAEASGCSRFVMISTDKAVNPSNVMGATKRVGELMVACRPARTMRCVSVRFGNVLGSNGSVIPVLQKQLREHRALTITHPDVTRFFMTPHEAVSLALQAVAIGNHGDTLLLEMGNPVRILDLARNLILLSGKSEDEVEIRFTGLRDGEKLFEELWYASEEVQPTSFPKIGRIRSAPYSWFELNRQLTQLRRTSLTRGEDAIRNKIKEIVPEYSGNSAEASAFSSDDPELPPSTMEILSEATVPQ
jgi:FlaA1/EpsC-like NDP-sugar epimerase